MHIDSYSFGRITINGRTYTSDVIVFEDRVLSPWWRKEGHLLQMEDLSEVMRQRPEVLIVGRGFSGIMRLAPGLEDELGRRGIKVLAAKTTEAVEAFNSRAGKGVVAALHLTC